MKDSIGSRSGFSSIKRGGLRMTSLPMRLFAKGNRLFWDPANIDFSQEAEDWRKLTDDEREISLLLAAEFLAGEESVAQDIQPFMSAMAAEGRLEDELYLTQFAFEEAKHVQVFRMWLDAVGETGDLQPLLDENPTYSHIFYELLPNALNALSTDPSPAAQVRAAVTYNQVIEGVLAMTGYHSWRRIIELRGVLPGMQEIVRLIARDERRHMAWGTYTCRRHIAADHSNWQVFEETINSLLGPAMDLVQFLFNQFEAAGRPMPFDLDRAEFESYAMQQFSRRIEVIEAAKTKSVGDIEHDTEDEQVEAELEAMDLAGSPGPVG